MVRVQEASGSNPDTPTIENDRFRPVVFLYSSAIEDYIVSRGDTFKMTNDDEIASYILGKWYWPYHIGFSGTYISDLEYFADGECIWSTWDSYFNEWDDAYCSWSVKDGFFDGCSADDSAVYRITDNAMVTAGNLYIRAN